MSRHSQHDPEDAPSTSDGDDAGWFGSIGERLTGSRPSPAAPEERPADRPHETPPRQGPPPSQPQGMPPQVNPQAHQQQQRPHGPPTGGQPWPHTGPQGPPQGPPPRTGSQQAPPPGVRTGPPSGPQPVTGPPPGPPRPQPGAGQQLPPQGWQQGPPRQGPPQGPPPALPPRPGGPAQQLPPMTGAQLPPGAQMPAVAPRAPGVRPPEALDEDAPQPTSVLGLTPPTQSLLPPKPAPSAPETSVPHPGQPGPSTDSAAFPAHGRRTGSRSTGRGRLGAGLVDVPMVPVRDPSSAVLPDPMVAENKRWCSSCGAEVGRARNGQPARTEGECEKCGTPFNFRPRLQRGDLVGGQYEVLGCLAYGGLGWIYLAKDHNVSDRWVVLKGLIDTGDATSMASAVAERRFLAEVEHPNVVKIYNFVQHPDAKTGTAVGYIVMEYVGGQSLRQLALQHHREAGRAEPLPIGQVIAYGLEILPAIGYLHSQDVLYCDLKPDNVIQAGEQLKLIDLGAVRRVDDWDSPLFFTLGYSAPELATEGASVASDIYTVGRTLAVLSIEFTGYTTKYVHTLPGPDEVPLFALFGSYYRVLKRATHEDPARRFLSGEDMADQLTGVLREVMALGTGRPRPGMSTVFGQENRTFGANPIVAERGAWLVPPEPADVAVALPLPQVDTDDPAAGVLAATTVTEPGELVEALAGASQESIEVRLRMLRAHLELGDLRSADADLSGARKLAIYQHDWRLDWYRGLILLSAKRFKEAHAAFDAVYDALPGEIAPKLALAISAEYAGDYFPAARFYELVWRTDRSYVSAAFGLARVYLAQGARGGAIEVLESVPDSSSHYVSAQVAAIKIKTRVNEVDQLGENDLHDAARKLERLALDAERRTHLSTEVLEAAYGWVRAGRPGSDGAGQAAARTVLGCGLSERELRLGLERCYRALARLASTPDQRHDLVDKANAIRPRTLT